VVGARYLWHLVHHAAAQHHLQLPTGVGRALSSTLKHSLNG
jgi:hypothetical protein